MKKYERVEFKEIVERIKDIISHEIKGRVYDKDVAKVLGISPVTLRIYKIKDILPYEAIVMFCANRKISFDKLVFHKGLIKDFR